MRDLVAAALRREPCRYLVVSVVCASLNVFAGYLITDRMLKMFKKRGSDQK